MSIELEKKVSGAIKLLRSISEIYGDVIEVAYSGGKDSDVILQLVKESGIPFRAIYKSTTIDPPGTIKHVQDMGVEIIRPKETFAQLIARKGLPNRKRRFCCDVLKEYKILDKVVIGIRREESPKRAERYNEPTQCKLYGKGCECEQILPILDWTLDDVTTFLKERHIQCAPVYYDEYGVFCPERRLGCIGCPLATRKHRITEFKTYPGMVKLYINACKRYFNSHPNSKTVQAMGNVYAYFARDVFYDGKPLGDMFDTDWKSALEEYFNINL